QDGTAWGFITRGFVRAPLLQTPQADFDPTRFQWIGTPSQETTVAGVWASNTKIRSLQDATQEEVVFGGTSLATDTGLFPTILNKLIGNRPVSVASEVPPNTTSSCVASCRLRILVFEAH